MPVVVIKSPRYIPGLGQGPINEPTYVSDDFYRQLIMQDFLVLKVPEKTVYFDDAVVDEDKPTTDEKVEETTKEEVPEVKEEEVKEESEPEDETDIVKIHGEELDLAPMTKNELKKLLDENEVTYMYKDNRARLVEKVKNELAD